MMGTGMAGMVKSFTKKVVNDARYTSFETPQLRFRTLALCSKGILPFTGKFFPDF